VGTARALRRAMRPSELLGLAMFTSAAVFGCGGDESADDGGSAECPANEPSEGDPCNFDSCTYAGCPSGQVGDGFRQYGCTEGTVDSPYIDMNCMISNGASTGTGLASGGGGAGGEGAGGGGDGGTGGAG
jgi:hypothetical protein